MKYYSHLQRIMKKRKEIHFSELCFKNIPRCAIYANLFMKKHLTDIKFKISLLNKVKILSP